MQRSPDWVGRKDRHPVEIEALIYRSDGITTRARLTDLTEQGCRMEADSLFRIGEFVQIAIPRMGQIKAQVRWALAGTAGARFLIESDF